MKKLRVVIVLVLWIIFAFTYFINKDKSSFCVTNENRLNLKFNGIVKDKKLNTRSHGNEKIVTDNNFTFYWEDRFYDEDSFYYKIDIGDMVSKSQGNFSLEIIKPDTIILINLHLPCDSLGE